MTVGDEHFTKVPEFVDCFIREIRFNVAPDPTVVTEILCNV